MAPCMRAEYENLYSPFFERSSFFFFFWAKFKLLGDAVLLQVESILFNART